MKTSAIRTFVVEPKCPDYGGSTVYILLLCYATTIMHPGLRPPPHLIVPSTATCDQFTSDSEIMISELSDWSVVQFTEV